MWEENFVTIDVNRPFGLMGKFIDELPSGLEPDSDQSLYQEAYNASGYKMWMDKVIAKFWDNEEYVKYYKLTRDLGDGITVLSADEYDSVKKAEELIMANPYVKGYFINEDPFNIELMHQVPIFFDWEFSYAGSLITEPCKALMDGIRINHKKKTIEPFDLKTTRSVYDFGSSYLQYGYYRQCAFYLKAMQSLNSPVRKYIDAGYEMLPFVFIVVENKKSSSHPAIIYETSEWDVLCGTFGGKVGNKVYKGNDGLMYDYQFHKETDFWDLPADIIQSKGRIKLNIFDGTKVEELRSTDAELTEG